MTDFTMFAGDSKTLEVTVKDADGVVVDITGATIRWSLARSVNSTPALLQKAVGSGITITDGPNGRFDVALANADTETLSDAYYHEAEVILLDGTIATVVSGAVTIKRTLIKPEA